MRDNIGKFDKILKKFQFLKKSFDFNTNTEIGPWFQFLIPTSGFGCTLKYVEEMLS